MNEEIFQNLVTVEVANCLVVDKTSWKATKSKKYIEFVNPGQRIHNRVIPFDFSKYDSAESLNKAICNCYAALHPGACTPTELLYKFGKYENGVNLTEGER